LKNSRSADILFTLATHSTLSSHSPALTKLYDLLVEARRALSLFQHHDGVTGTGRRLVVIDYGEK